LPRTPATRSGSGSNPMVGVTRLGVPSHSFPAFDPASIPASWYPHLGMSRKVTRNSYARCGDRCCWSGEPVGTSAQRQSPHRLTASRCKSKEAHLCDSRGCIERTCSSRGAGYPSRRAPGEVRSSPVRASLRLMASGGCQSAGSDPGGARVVDGTTLPQYATELVSGYCHALLRPPRRPRSGAARTPSRTSSMVPARIR
jgi:hypothetical protein